MIQIDAQLARGDFALDLALTTRADMVGVFGPSGAGKSTLIHIIAGLLRPDSGSVVLNGRTLVDRADNINIPAHRRNIGVVFQEHRLFPHYSVKGNLTYGASRDHPGLDAIVDLLELAPLLARPVGDLSGGERQRVGLGRALLSGPQMLLLDEPLASLDQRLRQQILRSLRRIRRTLSIPILYISHELGEILQLTDELVVLDQGRLVGQGTYRDLVHDTSVLSVIHDRGMTNMLCAHITAHHRGDGVTSITVGKRSPDAQGPAPQHASQLVVPIVPAAVGTEVALSIRPWDIALASQPVAGVSIRNQIRGIITRCTTHDRRVLVEIDIGVPIIAEISPRSAQAMDIKPASPIVCLIKSHAIRTITEFDPPASTTDTPRSVRLHAPTKPASTSADGTINQESPRA